MTRLFRLLPLFFLLFVFFMAGGSAAAGVILTEKEKEWLKKNPVIRFTGDPNWMPQESFTKEGKYIGIVSDYVKLLEQRLGIRFTIVPSKTWLQSLEMSNSKEVDVLSETENPERKKYLNFTKSYINFPVVVILRDHAPVVANPDELPAEPVIVVEGYGYLPEFLSKYPNLDYHYVATPREGLLKVSAGEAYAFIGAISSSGYLINEMGLDNLKIGGETPISLHLGFGVRKDMPLLVDILNKGIDSISQEELNHINQKWITTEYETTIDYSRLWKILSVIILFVLVIIYWNRKMAREVKKRKESEEKYRILFEKSDDALLIIDNGKLLDCNSSFLKLMGYDDKEAALDLHPSEFSPETQPDGMSSYEKAEKMMEIAMSKGSNHFEWIHLRSNGEVFPVEVWLTAIPYKERQIIHASWRDISERKQAEEVIKESEQKLSDIIDFLPDATLVIDTEGRVIAWNHSMEQLTGIKATDMLGKDDYEYSIPLYGKRRPILVDLVNKPLEELEQIYPGIKRESGVLTGENHLPFLKGSNNYYFFTASALYNIKGEITGAIEILHDITERKQLEVDLIEAKKMAESATQAKGDFLANMSHEIRTPMNAILGMNHLLLKTGLDPKQKNYTEKVQMSAQNLLGIINDILDFSKIEAGKLDMESIDFDINDVVENLSNVISIKAHEKDLEFIIAVDNDVPTFLVGDPLRLGQILLNLANNSIKFTEEGEIVLSIKLVEKIEDRVVLKFIIQDTGVGLSEEQRVKLFKAFNQADSSTTRKYGGTGLGLSISKRLTELMGGDIDVISEIGKGSSFYFTANFGLSANKKKKREIIPEELKNLRVLIVDDNESAREIHRKYLEDFSFSVSAVGGGKEALDELKNALQTGTKEYELVLMDWYMPGLNGIETSKLIRTDTTLSNKPAIIMVTGYGREDIVKQSDDIALDGFLLKPLTQSILFDSIMEAFGQKIERKSRVELENISLPEEFDSIRGANILLVEDNEINREVAVELLEAEGFNVSIAENGLEAVQKITGPSRSGGYDLVLMDIQMPVMDGYAATAAIRKDAKFSELPILATTADAMSGVKENVIESGMNDYITKPIDPVDLFQKLAKWIKPGERDFQKTGNAGIEHADIKAGELPDSLPGIDLKNGIRRVAGNKQLYEKLLTKFRNNNADCIDEIRSSLEDNDIKTAERIAHTLKGVGGNIGTEALARAAAEVNSAIKKGALDDIETLLESCEKELAIVLNSIEELENRQGKNKKDPAAEQKELSPADRERVKELLHPLPELLESDISMVMDSLPELKKYLENSRVRELFARFEEAVENFDTDGARGIITEIARGLDISLL
ncbi:MAG: response regulator [bacterium]|nr:response regulator [bacterium]